MYVGNAEAFNSSSFFLNRLQRRRPISQPIRSVYIDNGEAEGNVVSYMDRDAAIPSDVLDAVKTLIEWAGDDPTREGLVDTPNRVARAYKEFFRGYDEDPLLHLERTFEEVGGYDEIVLLRDIPLVSHCEHHIVPITGKAHVAYLPKNRVVGVSKLARVVNGFARRLQVQERLTAQIAEAIDTVLQPQGVAVVIEATHGCMSSRGVEAPTVVMTTSRMLGAFREDDKARREVMSLMGF